MKLAALCCTFRRPHTLGQLIESYLRQDYPRELRELIILDDAGQYENQSGVGWQLVSIPRRFPATSASCIRRWGRPAAPAVRGRCRPCRTATGAPSMNYTYNTPGTYIFEFGSSAADPLGSGSGQFDSVVITVSARMAQVVRPQRSSYHMVNSVISCPIRLP